MPTQATAAVFATHTRKPAEGRGFVSPFIGSAFAALTRRRVAVNSLYIPRPRASAELLQVGSGLRALYRYRYYGRQSTHEWAVMAVDQYRYFI